MNVDLFAITELGVTQQYVGPLLAVLALGVGVGSVLAGVWSAGKVELGIVPVGAGTLAVSSILLFGVPSPADGSLWGAYGLTCLCLLCLGIGAGLVRRAAASLPPAPQPRPIAGRDPGGDQFSDLLGHVGCVRRVLAVPPGSGALGAGHLSAGRTGHDSGVRLYRLAAARGDRPVPGLAAEPDDLSGATSKGMENLPGARAVPCWWPTTSLGSTACC